MNEPPSVHPPADFLCPRHSLTDLDRHLPCRRGRVTTIVTRTSVWILKLSPVSIHRTASKKLSGAGSKG